MSWLGTIFGKGIKEAAGGVSGAVVDIAGKTADIVERWHPSEAAKHEMRVELDKLVVDAQASARSYDPRSQGGGVFGEIVNVLVDAVSRAIRPFVTIGLIGGALGWWQIEVQEMGAVAQGYLEVVLGFWFGYRSVTKDVPAAIAAIKKAVRS